MLSKNVSVFSNNHEPYFGLNIIGNVTTLLNPNITSTTNGVKFNVAFQSLCSTGELFLLEKVAGHIDNAGPNAGYFLRKLSAMGSLKAIAHFSTNEYFGDYIVHDIRSITCDQVGDAYILDVYYGDTPSVDGYKYPIIKVFKVLSSTPNISHFFHFEILPKAGALAANYGCNLKLTIDSVLIDSSNKLRIFFSYPIDGYNCEDRVILPPSFGDVNFIDTKEWGPLHSSISYFFTSKNLYYGFFSSSSMYSMGLLLYKINYDTKVRTYIAGELHESSTSMFCNVDGTGFDAKIVPQATFLADSTEKNIYIFSSYCQSAYPVELSRKTIVRKSTNGVVTTIAGSSSQGVIDGVGTAATFFDIRDVAMGTNDKFIFICDGPNEIIRVLSTLTYEVTTIAGSSNAYSTAYSTSHMMDGLGPEAVFSNSFTIIGADNFNNLFIKDSGTIRKVSLLIPTPSDEKHSESEELSTLTCYVGKDKQLYADFVVSSNISEYSCVSICGCSEPYLDNPTRTVLCSPTYEHFHYLILNTDELEKVKDIVDEDTQGSYRIESCGSDLCNIPMVSCQYGSYLVDSTVIPTSAVSFRPSQAIEAITVVLWFICLPLCVCSYFCFRKFRNFNKEKPIVNQFQHVPLGDDANDLINLL